MFQAIYDSAWHHPGMAFLGVFLFVVALARTQRFLVAFSILFAFEMAADALVTGAFSPSRSHPSVHFAASVATVVSGDFRYFLLVEHVSRAPSTLERRGFGDGWSWLVAFGLAMTVPLLSTIPQLALPHVFTSETRIFLLYEVMVFLFVGALRVLFAHRLSRATPDLARWVRGLTVFELAQYGAWIGSDILILGGVELGHVVRILPNALYYCGFLPFAFFSAPPRLWRADKGVS